MFRLALLGFVALLSMAFTPEAVYAENQCAPLPAGVVPDESVHGWTVRTFSPVDLVIETQTQNGQNVIIGERKYYIHDNGMKLGVYWYFGKVGFKAWSCDKDRDPVTGDTPDHMIAIPQPDGNWFVKHAQSPDKVEVIFGADGNPKVVRVTLHGVETAIEK